MKHTLWTGSFFVALFILGMYYQVAEGQRKIGKTTAAVDNDGALTVAFSPNGRMLAGAGLGKPIRIWDSRTGKLLHSLEGPKRTPVRSIAFSPDGKALLGGGYDCVVHEWNVQTGSLERSFPGPAGFNEILSIALSPDGKKLAVAYAKFQEGGSKSEVTVLELATGKLQWSRTGDKGVHSVAFAADGKTLAAADGAVHLLNAETGEPIKSLRIEDRQVLNISFSADGSTLAGGGGHWVKVGAGTQQISEAYLWDFPTGNLVHKLTDLRPWLRSVALSPDGTILATGSSGPIREQPGLTWVSSESRLWDAKAGRLLRIIPGESGDVGSLAFSPDARSLLCCDQRTVTLIETRTGLQRLTLSKQAPGWSAAPVDLQRWWTELGSSDGTEAYRAMGQLATASQESVPFLNKHLKAVQSIPTQKIPQLIVSLDSDQFAERENAQKELEKLEELAAEELSKTLARGASAETRNRIDRLLKRLDVLKNPERLRNLRAIEVLENIGTPEAKRILQKIAAGAAQAQQTREARASLERFGKRTKPASLP